MANVHLGIERYFRCSTAWDRRNSRLSDEPLRDGCGKQKQILPFFNLKPASCSSTRLPTEVSPGRANDASTSQRNTQRFRQLAARHSCFTDRSSAFGFALRRVLRTMASFAATRSSCRKMHSSTDWNPASIVYVGYAKEPVTSETRPFCAKRFRHYGLSLRAARRFSRRHDNASGAPISRSYSSDGNCRAGECSSHAEGVVRLQRALQDPGRPRR
jgi:hypothetical protein